MKLVVAQARRGILAAVGHGTVSEVKLIMDRETGQSRGFGFVTMGNVSEGNAAIESLARASFQELHQFLPKRKAEESSFPIRRMKEESFYILVTPTRDARRIFLPRIRIEDLLRDVDKRCGFTQTFRPLPGYESRLENLYPTPLAAITAHATNLGTAAMAQSAEGITLEGLQEVSRWYLGEATLKASNTVLINYHHQSALSGVWGSGTVSSWDEQRFGIQRSSLGPPFIRATSAITIERLLAAFLPRRDASPEQVLSHMHRRTNVKTNDGNLTPNATRRGDLK
jgi:hypothetical protein